MTHKINFHPGVYEEINAAYIWYESKSTGLGKKFINELDSAVLAINQLPFSWSKYASRFHRYFLKKFPFAVVYKINNDEITILA